jgi:hypothetical protein
LLARGVPARRSADRLTASPYAWRACRGFWARHRRKILVSLGVAGVGYAAYHFYDARRAQVVRVEQLCAMEEQAADDLVKNQYEFSAPSSSSTRGWITWVSLYRYSLHCLGAACSCSPLFYSILPLPEVGGGIRPQFTKLRLHVDLSSVSAALDWAHRLSSLQLNWTRTMLTSLLIY